MKNFKRYLITSALPYANGPVHIGHLAGVYIPSDIYTRYLREKGVEVISVCGSDEHGVPITIKARQENTTPQAVVDKYNSIIKDSFEKFGISFDIYSRTTSRVHYQTASEFFRNLYDKGVFIEKTTEQYYDEEVKQFLADRYITGTCPHCSNDRAYGDQCEKCGTSLNPTDLIDPKSTLSGSKPVLKATKHWFLPLDKFQPDLEKWILQEHKEWKTNVYGQCKSWLDQGLQPRAVSRDLDWGVPVPVEGSEGKVLYVWFDAPIGYISATKECTPEWEKYWKSPDTRMIHFIGKDNIVFHCIIFPAMLKAEGSYILPDNVPANEFLNLEGDKISTSRNWAVWLHEYLEEFPGKQDVLRYVLTANMPETKDNDFTWKDFQTRNNSELVAILGNFINRAMVLTQKYFDSKIPAAAEILDYDKETIAEIPRIKQAIESNLEEFRFREALKEAMNLARLGNKYLADTEPWKMYKQDPERVATILNISMQITANLAILLEPFLPFTADKIRKMIDFADNKWEHAGSANLLKAGHKLNQPELLFDKIEDETINVQLAKLQATKEANAQKQVVNVQPQKDAVSYDDFSKMDIRIGKVLEAERVPKTQKLMKLKVDTGIDTRTLVSGIAEHFTPEQVVGRQVSILVNLEPRSIKGIESHGMILMAEDADGKLKFVQPSDDVANGSTVK
ncbi:MAG TPA: methionine--tRNA ligase [Tenuifilaceae bacterium]|nr:methionine--tRNA ligase [Tenuifilaceae bacterium]HPI44468.1 methionine--tRNA ligase [Tenuifilaceae bacterium]HPN22412.1 methionine--tRNA ligase [Tenuifilaceae bacterium]HPV55608.1 methionine--tRNA ligase [Tenuifilaceae bacterium]